ncbi:nitroreductase family protein [Konateibacter massiliensis]|uniref:nitroreductase family protein n=1 Tax=Konateibacter massiliensis TaxID=2002841 RepID=UPI000C15D23B|nr:nitroreductase family protein [Konateibacter massiliensis]
MSAIFTRTSVRSYEDKEVEAEKVEQLLRAAMAAPSAGNQQPWEFYVVTDKSKLEKLSKCSMYAGCAKDAPLAIVNCYRKEIKMPEYAEIDLSASTQNLLLEATELGLGAVWLGIAPHKGRMEAVREILEIPEELEVFAVIPCGYPQKTAKQQDRYEEARIHYVK